MADFISPAINLALNVGERIWDATRTNLKVVFNNRQSEYKLVGFTRWCRRGECVKTSKDEVLPGRETTAEFRNSSTGILAEGCAMYEFRLMGERLSTNRFYMAVGWSVGVGVDSKLYLDSFEIDRGQEPTGENLRELFADTIDTGLSAVMDVTHYFKPSSSHPAIKITASMNDIYRSGEIHVTLTKGECGSGRPKTWEKLSYKPDESDESDDDDESEANLLSLSTIRGGFSTGINIEIKNSHEGIDLVDSRLKSFRRPTLSIHREGPINGLGVRKSRIKNNMFHDTVGVLVYELRQSNSELPLFWDKRVFLVVSYKIALRQSTRVACAKLIAARDKEFPRADPCVRDGYNTLFKHIMSRDRKSLSTLWVSEDLDIRLSARFKNHKDSHLVVSLSKEGSSRIRIDPFFLPTKGYKIPTPKIPEQPKNDLREKRSPYIWGWKVEDDKFTLEGGEKEEEEAFGKSERNSVLSGRYWRLKFIEDGQYGKIAYSCHYIKPSSNNIPLQQQRCLVITKRTVSEAGFGRIAPVVLFVQPIKEKQFLEDLRRFQSLTNEEEKENGLKLFEPYEQAMLFEQNVKFPNGEEVALIAYQEACAPFRKTQFLVNPYDPRHLFKERDLPENMPKPEKFIDEARIKVRSNIPSIELEHINFLATGYITDPKELPKKSGEELNYKFQLLPYKEWHSICLHFVIADIRPNRVTEDQDIYTYFDLTKLDKKTNPTYRFRTRIYKFSPSNEQPKRWKLKDEEAISNGTISNPASSQESESQFPFDLTIEHDLNDPDSPLFLIDIMSPDSKKPSDPSG